MKFLDVGFIVYIYIYIGFKKQSNGKKKKKVFLPLKSLTSPRGKNTCAICVSSFRLVQIFKWFVLDLLFRRITSQDIVFLFLEAFTVYIHQYSKQQTPLPCLKTLDMLGNCQQPVHLLGVSQHLHKQQTCENLRSIGHRICKRILKEKTPLLHYFVCSQMHNKRFQLNCCIT